MARVEIVSKARVREWSGGASVEQNTYAKASEESTLRSVSGNLAMTSDGTAQIAYEMHKRGR